MPRLTLRSRVHKEIRRKRKESYGAGEGTSSQSNHQVSQSSAHVVNTGHVSDGEFSNAPEVKQRQLSNADMIEAGNHTDGMCTRPSSQGQNINRGHSSSSSSAPVSDENPVMNDQHDASKEQLVNQNKSKALYADVVKRRHEAGAGPSHVQTINYGEPVPLMTRVCAQYSQAANKYSDYSKGKQCMANSLVFLAYLRENEYITRGDLNKVLDKGDELYKEIARRFNHNNFLATDELPDHITSRKIKYRVDLTHQPHYGTYGGSDDVLSLAEGLTCLDSDVQYALLVLNNLCVAVFKTRSGEYGVFDPHSRNKHGLVPSHDLELPSAIMLKFSRLSDLIDRIYLLHSQFSTPSLTQYEIKPVSFYIIPSSPRNVSHADFQPPVGNAPTLSHEALNESDRHATIDQSDNISPEMTANKNVEQPEPETASFTTQDSLPCESDMVTREMSTTSDLPADIMQDVSTDTSVPVPTREEVETPTNLEPQMTFIAQAGARCDAAVDISETVLLNISQKLSKLSKQRRRKMKRRLMKATKPRQTKKDKNQKERQRYSSDILYRTTKTCSSARRYQNNADIRKKMTQYIRTKYQHNAEFRDRQRCYVRNSYRENPEFRERQRCYVRNSYRENPEFRETQRLYIRSLYRLSEQFRLRQRNYMKNYIVRRYANDNSFRLRHRQLMKRRMKDRYNNNCLFKMMHNIRCATDIKRKYRRMNRITPCVETETVNRVNETLEQNQTEPENRVINEAISAFRSNIKAGPTYVCSSCHKASFPNQVKPCRRSNYEKKPEVTAQCLKGKYVHVCDESCINDQCSVPDERKKEWVCHTCHNHLKKGNMPSLAAANKLELHEIPPELCDLNILERHLIAKCIPFAKIVPLPRGRQRQILGNVVCVPSEVNETINTLPRLRSESQVLRVKLKRRLSYRGHQLFQSVTWSKLVRALLKLKEINPQYKDITIRDEAQLCDPTLPDADEDDDSMEEDDYDESDLMEIDRYEHDALVEAENEPESDHNMQTDTEPHSDDAEQDNLPNGGFALVSCLQPVDVSEEILCFSDDIYCVAPAERNQPVSFFKTPKLEALAFPTQFPTAENTLDEARSRYVTPSGYFKSRLFHIDERFARDPNYLFFAQFVTEIHLANSSMMVQLRKGKTKTRDGREISSGMLQDKTEVQRLIRNKDAVRFMTPLRGTPAYWEKTSKDLFAMIRQLGPPTFFLTFSAAEFRWPEVITAIKKQQGEHVDFDVLDWMQKSEILRSNPVTSMRMFDKRVEALFRDLLLSPAEPLGKIVDFFYRLEFQHRGSPHIHCLIWIENPVEIDVHDDQTVCNFVDKYISAQLPDPGTQPELYTKVSELQKHSKNHTRTCFKSVNSGCRFGFPKPPCRKTMIARLDEDGDIDAAKEKLRPLMDLLNEPEVASLSFEQILSRCNLTLAEYEHSLCLMKKKTSIYLKRDPKDCWINNYNPYLLKAWDANIDVSFIINAYSCIEYLCKYITKQETNLSNYLTDVLQSADRDQVNECDEMRAVMQAYMKKREVSAQECVARACGIKMKKSSRSVVFVPTDENPVRMSRPMSFLEEMEPESCNVWMTSLSDKYKARPEQLEYEQMCLADFAANCRFVSSLDAKKKDVFPLLNGLGYVKKRTNDKPAIIRYYHCSKEKHPEEFHERLLRLYLPHRSERELKGSFPTYESFFSSGLVRLAGTNRVVCVSYVVNRNKDNYEKHSETIDEALGEFEENHNLVIDEWCNLAPESEVVRLDFDDDVGEPIIEGEQENVPDLCPESNAVPELRVIREAPAIDPAILRGMYQNLNQKQTCVFYAIRDWCIKRVCDLNPDRFFLYVNGGAGTGKSHLIKCIHAEASKILSRLPTHAEEPDISSPTVFLTAFTGTAAFGIGGTTLHSLLHLPRSLKPPIQGLGNKLDEVRAELFNAEIIIIDEISMVSKQLFAYVDARLKQIKGNNRPFGGVSVLCVGDFFQLPPVRQSKPLCVHDPTQIDLWQEHFQMITLTEIMRQKDDVAFAEMLNRIRVKGKDDSLSNNDRALLTQAITRPELCSNDVLHILPTNKLVEQHNAATLSQLFTNIIIIDADDFQKDPKTNRMVRRDTPCKGERSDLPDTLKVAEGARVMLTRNIDIRKGLVNGAFGTLVSVVTSENDQHVTKLGLRMDNQTLVRRNGPPGSDDLVYIERVEDNQTKKGVVRRQFPVRLAFSSTIHKTQGLTTRAAVVSLKDVFEAGMAYVALSRVTSLSGLYLLDLDEKKIYANPEVSEAIQSMRQASVDDMMPLLPLRETASRPDTLTIVHHNTEGLPSHIDDIKRHHELCLSDVLCLTETHLQGSFVAESLQLDGYTMFKRNRHTSYTNLPEMASRSGGGVAVYVRNHIQVCEKKYFHGVTDLEFVVLKVEAPVQALIATIYRPPNYSLRPFLENLVSLLDALQVMDIQPIIVCGDFNENQLLRTAKPILELFQSKGYAQVITSATTEKNTLLDLVFISQPQRCLHSGLLRTYFSYHNPVFTIVSTSKS